MRKSVTGVVLVIAAVLLVPVISYAAGLGKMTVRSALGQPLDAEIEIVSLQPGEEDSFTVRLAPREAFTQTGIEFSPALASARFSIERRDGKSVIRISTTQPVNDPFLNVLVELQWPNGRLAREYTVLVDPLEYKAAQAAEPVRAQAVPAAPAQAAPAPAPAAVLAATPAPVQAAAAARTPAPAPVTVPPAPRSASPAPAAPARAEALAAAPAPVVAVPHTQAPTSAQVDMREPAPVPTRPVATAPESAIAPAAVAAARAPKQVAAAPAPAQVAPAPAPTQITPAPASVPAPVQNVAPAPAVTATPAPAEPARTSMAVAAPESKPVRNLQAADSYRIRRGDTLGAIARKWKPAEVTLDQMMIALYQRNGHVFIRNNINLIRAGAILAIPQREQVVAIEAGSALRQVKSQMAEFARYRRQQDGTVATASVRTTPGQGEGTGRRVTVRKTARSL